jgi:RimJ/RimL family protein N-acetyltransferase
VLRPADQRDVAAIREWRNQSANREISINRHEISLEEHQAWWARTSADPSRRVLIFGADGRPLGVVNFFDLEPDDAPKSGAWGFFLDNETAVADGTAMLLWVRVMSEAIAYAFDELGLDTLNAEVLAHNSAVRVMNRRYGFVEGDPEERESDGRTISVIPISLRREDRRGRRGR